jgi:hypothetical protein
MKAKRLVIAGLIDLTSIRRRATPVDNLAFIQNAEVILYSTAPYALTETN